MSEETGLDDIHGFFQFVGGSDSEGDDGLFVAARDRKQKFDVDQINYTPRIDEDAWFDRSNLDVASWISKHGGLDEILFTVQRLYFKKEYMRAADICRQTINAYTKCADGRQPRIANIREIIDIGACASMQSDDLVSTEYFYDWYLQCGGMNPGYNSFQAKVLTRLGRLEEALQQHILYLEQRQQDAQVWENIGLVLKSLAQQNAELANAQQVFLQLAMASFCRAFLIIFQSKSWKQIDVVIKRRRLQIQRLWLNAIDTAHLLFITVDTSDNAAESESVWLQLQKDCAVDQLQLSSLPSNCSDSLRKSVKWITLQLSTTNISSDYTIDTHDAKGVAEL
ncbi:hypothetical protein IWW36_001880 [Coemansia brasiliensis]|uniref:Uncharacterized protein n=1 Tax=Coemansia brasiliensis TaxID=2650707 RepID=A0A9W8I8X4_9FUNG|nr:hypothetical protein IWW36_001880 [Coemansia brasiliensis]